MDKTQLLSTLPPSLVSDERFRNLCELLYAQYENLPLDKVLLYLIDAAPEAALLPLAEQFHVMGVEGWIFAQTASEQRALIKRSIELHRAKGTRWAMEQVLVTLGMRGRVSEWFEYGGAPYHFRIDIDLSGRGMGEQDVQRLGELIAQYKNVRSHLETLALNLTVQSPVPVIASALSAGETLTVWPWTLTELVQSGTTTIAAGCWVIEQVCIYPQIH